MSRHYENPEILRMQRPDPQGGRQRTDVPRLIQELIRPKDFRGILTRFDAGDTVVRDISMLTATERREVIRVGSLGLTRMPVPTWRAFQKAASNLRYGMEHPEHLQASAGMNFLLNAQGFVNAGLPWARAIDRSVGREFPGQDVNSIIPMLQRNRRVPPEAVVKQVAARQDNVYDIGYYLAERSDISEQFQESHFRAELDTAKANVQRTFLTLVQEMGLPSSHALRTIGQINRVTFSAFDHLLKGVTVHDNNTLADYLPGTLRVEAKFIGSPRAAQPPSSAEATASLQHEVWHAAAAQDSEGACGLSLNGNGVEIDEAMAEYLNQITSGFPDYVQTSRNSFRFDCSYGTRVSIMHALRLNNPQAFASLFHGYFGNRRADLPRAVQQYYSLLQPAA